MHRGLATDDGVGHYGPQAGATPAQAGARLEIPSALADKQPVAPGRRRYVSLTFSHPIPTFFKA